MPNVSDIDENLFELVVGINQSYPGVKIMKYWSDAGSACHHKSMVKLSPQLKFQHLSGRFNGSGYDNSIT